MGWACFGQLRYLLALWISIFVLGACSQPVLRGDKTQEKPPPISPAKAKAEKDLPDLKKRIWILNFAENPNPPPELEKISVSEILQREIIEHFSKEDSPFLAQTREDENAFVGFHLDELKDAQEIARRLRGSDVAGFLMGKIVNIATRQRGAEEPGLLKTRKLDFILEVEWQLFDTNTGRQIASGSESQTYTETRSDFLGLDAQLSELPKKVSRMSERIAERLDGRLKAFSKKLAWSGRVLRIEGGRIYINAGRRSGLVVGDVLKVVEAPKEIVDPQSGGFVGSAPGRMKGTIKLIQYFGEDASVAVLQTGGGIFPGDRVELY